MKEKKKGDKRVEERKDRVWEKWNTQKEKRGKQECCSGKLHITHAEERFIDGLSISLGVEECAI